ncbi:hypothetical protein [Dactylosporangium sp. CA-092794]|uniref:hypothetical protein n=1 Tax=Dactylosporangium sp. CA-092794 TaxID=3239929 RepID=UPI003D94DD13
MGATMFVAAIVASVYVGMIAMYTAVIRKRGPSADGSDPRIAVWLAESAARRRDRAERAATQALLTGHLDRAEYQAAMATTAARENAEHPLEVPRSRL